MMHSMSSKSRSRSTHSKKSPARSTLKNRVHAEHVPTFHGLHGWMSHVFEHLGWMVLAKKYGYTDKLVSYKSSVDRLADALEKRLEMIQEPDLAKPLTSCRCTRTSWCSRRSSRRTSRMLYC